MATNWLLELGIPFDPPPGQGEISDILDQREREFSLNANKGEQGSYYSVMLERLAFVRAELADKEKLAQYAEQAKRVSYPVIDQLISQTKGLDAESPDPDKVQEITGFAQDIIGDRAGMTHVVLPDGLVEERIRFTSAGLGGSVSQKDDEAVRTYQLLVEKKPDGQHKFRSFEKDLSLFSADNLYDYAMGGNASWDEIRDASIEDLLERIEAKVGDLRKGSSERSAAERLRTRAREICADSREWEKYCTYLAWRDTRESLERLARLARLSDGSLTQESVRMAVDKIAELQGDAQKAELVVRGYCASQDPPLEMPDMQAGKKGKGKSSSGARRMPRIQADSSGINLVTCPHCGKRTNNGPYCAECGKSLSPTGRATNVQSTIASNVAGYGSAGQFPDARQMQQPVMQQQMGTQVYNLGVPSGPAQQQEVYSAPPAEPRKGSKLPAIIASALVVVAIAMVAFVFAGGLASSQDSVSPGVEVDAGSAVEVASSTRITPQITDGEPITLYTVELKQRPGNADSGDFSELLMEINVSGDGGFSMQDFMKYGATLSSKRYELILTDSATNNQYKLYVNYQTSTEGVDDEIKLMC